MGQGGKIHTGQPDPRDRSGRCDRRYRRYRPQSHTMLLAKRRKVRALVRRDDERADSLRRLGAEIVRGDLRDLASMHRAIEGCARIYFGMSVSSVYLEATVTPPQWRAITASRPSSTCRK